MGMVLLVAITRANPIAVPASVSLCQSAKIELTIYSSGEEVKINPMITHCLAAPNCETYGTEDGTLIRFKDGHEPGTDTYSNMTRELAKRDDYHTDVTFGTNSMNYGTTLPQDALAHL